MRCVVFAYHDIGCVCLRALLDAGVEVAAVFTHDDDPGENVWFGSVRKVAEAAGIPVYAPENVNTAEWVARVTELQPDFIFSFYYRKLLKRPLLEIARRGALNLHGSLLPKYRGRCPVNWVLIHDEHETGVSLHYMEEKPDRGEVVAQRSVPITDADTALTLFHKLTAAAGPLLKEVIPQLRDGTAPKVPQDHQAASYFGGRTADDGRLVWTQSARQIFNLVRAVTHPYPGAFCWWKETKLFVWASRVAANTGSSAKPGTLFLEPEGLKVQTGTGTVLLDRVQLDGDTERSGSEWASINRITEGMQLE